jgi:hypothetical protein
MRRRWRKFKRRAVMAARGIPLVATTSRMV